jgi:hypothetical protein
MYRPGYPFAQGGVALGGLSEALYRQRGLFDQEEFEHRTKLEKCAYAVDAVNKDVGGRLV